MFKKPCLCEEGRGFFVPRAMGGSGRRGVFRFSSFEAIDAKLPKQVLDHQMVWGGPLNRHFMELVASARGPAGGQKLVVRLQDTQHFSDLSDFELRTHSRC